MMKCGMTRKTSALKTSMLTNIAQDWMNIHVASTNGQIAQRPSQVATWK